MYSSNYINVNFSTLKSKYFLKDPRKQPNPVSLVYVLEQNLCLLEVNSGERGGGGGRRGEGRGPSSPKTS